MHLDVRSDAGYVMFDADKHLVQSTSKVVMPGLGLEIATWVAAEAISIYPRERGNGAMHKAYFKDSNWTWEPY